MPEQPQRGESPHDEELDGVADLAKEAVAELRDGARWVTANLRDMMTALGVRDVDGSDPDDHDG